MKKNEIAVTAQIRKEAFAKKKVLKNEFRQESINQLLKKQMESIYDRLELIYTKGQSEPIVDFELSEFRAGVILSKLDLIRRAVRHIMTELDYLDPKVDPEKEAFESYQRTGVWFYYEDPYPNDLLTGITLSQNL